MSAVDNGFPWHSQSQRDAPQQMTEKAADVERKEQDPPNVLADVVNKQSPWRSGSEKQRSNTKSKKRSGSFHASNSQKSTSKPQRDYSVPPGVMRHYNVRTIPAWVRDATEDDLEFLNEAAELDNPHAALVARHNHAPSDLQRPERDYFTPPGGYRPERRSQWVSFGRASAYPREQFDGETVDVAWLNEHFTDYSKPWLAGQDDNDAEEGSGIYRAFKRKRKAWYQRMQYQILNNPFVPLALRFTVLIFAAAAIGLGASIYRDTGVIAVCLEQATDSRTQGCVDLLGSGPVDYYRDPSALMAIIVDVISIVYTLYITYDEYFSKPLGLRPARAKVRLILLDLFFIVFQAANLSLAFESLTVDDGACAVGDEPPTSIRFDHICNRAEALSSVLIVSLVAWLLTFSVSVLRLVERMDR